MVATRKSEAPALVLTPRLEQALQGWAKLDKESKHALTCTFARILRGDTPYGLCVVCGCSDESGCETVAVGIDGVSSEYGSCSWVDRGHTVCSACIPEHKLLVRAARRGLELLKAAEVPGGRGLPKGVR